MKFYHQLVGDKDLKDVGMRICIHLGVELEP